jgi:hypothetical protein
LICPMIRARSRRSRPSDEAFPRYANDPSTGPALPPCASGRTHAATGRTSPGIVEHLSAPCRRAIRACTAERDRCGRKARRPTSLPARIDSPCRRARSTPNGPYFPRQRPVASPEGFQKWPCQCGATQNRPEGGCQIAEKWLTDAYTSRSGLFSAVDSSHAPVRSRST